MEKYMRQFLYATVFLTGAAVLVIEVTATRVLAPHFGASLFVLSSVLTVILGALSVGYYAGGKISDRLPVHQILFGIIGISGITLLISENVALFILPYIGESITVKTMIAGPLILGTLFFFIPAFLLGLVSPFVIKLQILATDTTHIGSVVGRTFFWGTIGSIVGSLATGFLLVPMLGVSLSIISTALAMVLLGIVGIHLTRKMPVPIPPWPYRIVTYPTYFILTTLLLSAGLFSLTQMVHSTEMRTVLYDSEGLYSHLLVYESKFHGHTVRVLKQDTNPSSAVDMDSYDLLYGYAHFVEKYPILKPDARLFYMIGAGSYSIPRTLVARNTAIDIDVSEIEPSLPALAETYFDVHDWSRIHTFFQDGRTFLAQSTTTYDVIFGDAFITDYSVPSHLITREFFLEVQKSLKPDGVLILNSVGILGGEAPTFTGSLVRTIQSVFPNLKIYAFQPTDPTKLQNILYIARNGDTPIDLENEFVRATYDTTEVRIGDIEIPLWYFDIKNELTLTDDHVPTEYLMLAQFKKK
jgi:spermidine synthase